MAPRTPAGQMLSMKRCRSRSIVVTIGLPGCRRQRGRAALLPHQAAARVHLDVADAGAAPQRVVVLPLQPGLPHDGAQVGARDSGRLEVGLRHLGDVADQVGHRLAGGIEPLGLRLDDEAGEDGAVLLQPRRRRTTRRRTPPPAGSAPPAAPMMSATRALSSGTTARPGPAPRAGSRRTARAA